MEKSGKKVWEEKKPDTQHTLKEQIIPIKIILSYEGTQTPD